MDFNASDTGDDAERLPAQAFQSESSEHVPVAPAPPVAGPADAYQHEDDELVWPAD